MPRWAKAAVAAAVVLGLGGWIAEPYAQDWWLAREACGGVLPTDAVKQLMPEDTHLVDEEERRVEGLGSYACRLTVEGGDDGHSRFLESTAYTRRDDLDREFMALYPEEGYSPQAPLPEGLPGFVDQYGDIRLLLPCPGLGTDAAGRQRNLLVVTGLSRDAERSAATQNVYETAVALANSASERLGCGAEPLTAPTRIREPLDLTDVGNPKTVPLPQVKGTPCGWLAGAGLPRETQWRVAVRTNGIAPVGRCDVRAEGVGPGGEEQGLTFLAWYGDWSARLVTFDGKPRSMTASARCQGKTAHYAMSGSDDVPGVGPAAERRLLKAFVRDEAGRRGCSGVEFHL
jgi:hypothetical protein